MTYQFGDLVLDKYRVEVILGQGAYGDVFRVSHQEMDTTRVIRVFNRFQHNRSRVSFEKVRLRFKMETELSASLNSPKANPHLLQVYDLNEAKDELVLEMDYAPGGNLLDRVSEYKSKGIPFPRDKALRVAYEAASGLSALHLLDIVHGNIKPTNILFNQRHTACLCDLGLSQIPASLFSTSPVDIPVVHPEAHVYMSPEQLLSVDRIKPTSDIYSLGMVLFEILTGRTLISAGPRTRLSDFIPGIRPSLDDLMLRMLSEQPGNRIPNARTLALELVKELDAEEMAQMEIQAKRRRELDEWERLKKEELTRHKSHENTQPIIKERRKLDLAARNAAIPQPETEMPIPAAQPVLEEPVPPQPEMVGEPLRIMDNRKKLLKFGIPAAIVLAVAVGIFTFSNFAKNPPETSAQIITGQPAVPDTPNPTGIPVAGNDEPVETAVQPSLDVTGESPILLNTLPEPTQPPLNPATIPPMDPEVMLNPGFEDDTSWTIKIGDDHIIGNYSDKWASEGKQSYRFQLFGNSVYEYCLIPGMRTSVNQTVDLTDVDEIFFDMKFQPPAITEGFHGDVINTSAIVFIDGELVFESTDDMPEARLDQRISLHDNYPGKHDLKFGLMVKSRFCVKGNSEEESLMRYFDNIRFRYN